MKLSVPVTLSDAAQILNCTYLGDANQLIYGINEIHKVDWGDLTFVDVQKYYNKALNSAATVILINQSVAPPEGKGLLISEDPFRDFNRLTEYFQPTTTLDTAGTPFLGKNVKVGQHVVFGEGVEIGEGTEIGHNVVLGSHVKIGKNCRVHANVTLYDRVIIGDEVCINAGTVIGSEAFYFKSREESKEKMLTKGRVVIANYVDIGANCTIDRGVTGDTYIGEWTKLDNLIQIGHDTVIGKRCIIASQVGIAGVVTVEDDVVIWGQVGITKDVTIGKKVVILAKSGVISSLETGKTYYGFLAVPHFQKMREIASLKKLPDLLKKWAGKEEVS